jgi:tetratricopeptide (TPR) repeat protein
MAPEEVVMRRYLVAVLVVGLLAEFAAGQQVGQGEGGSAQPKSGAPSGKKVEFPDRPELLRRIALYEAAARKAEAAPPADGSLVRIYRELGLMYENLAMYPRSEQATRRALWLLREGSPSDLAEATSDLARLHMAMGELRQSEREELESLRLRERVGEPVAIARSWNQLATVYIKRHQNRKAVEFAQKAMAVLGDGPRVDPVDRIGVRFTLARALCESRECGRAIPLLKEAIELSKDTFGTDGLPVGFCNYLLGYAYWRNGDMDEASVWMERGTARMKVELGWGHPGYLDALTQYAEFLRERGRKEAAVAVEREVKQAQAVVDVRALATRPGALGMAGSR